MTAATPQPPPRPRMDAATERRRENERKLMEDSADIEVLEDTLAKSTMLSDQMVDMLHSFDDRLRGFEQSILPIHRLTQRLNRYYENLDRTLVAANRVIQYYDLADVERVVISNGPDEANLVPYLESLGRVSDAIAFLVESRFSSGEKAIYKLRQQQNSGIVQLVDLFKRRLVAISVPLDVAEQIRSTAATANVSGLPAIPTPMPADVRRVTDLATWLAASPAGASSAAEGTDPATSSISGGSAVGDPSDYAAVYVQVRGSYMQRSLAPLAAAAGDPRARAEAKAAAAFVQLTSWLAALVNAETPLVSSVFPHASPRGCAAIVEQTAAAAVGAFLAAGDALLAQIKRSGGKSDAGQIVVLFEVLEFWSKRRDELGGIFDGMSQKSAAIEALFDAWTTSALRIVPDFMDEVAHPAKLTAPPDGTVHEATSNTISFMKRLLEYPDSTESILLSIGEPDWSNATIRVADIKYITSSGSLTRKYFYQVLTALESTLETRGKTYKKPALAIIFHANNVHYILKNVKQGKLNGLLGVDGVLKYERTLKRHRDAFQDQFRPLLEHLMDVTVIHGGAIRKDMSNGERTAVKDKFAKFNTAIEDAAKAFRGCSVADPDLRGILVRDARGSIVPMYERFLGKYQASDFSKHKEKYIKYDVTQVGQMLDQLFLTS
ncbi:Cullin repeat-like-containing domain protein [Blastocladiella britannica]|nr:Cullin repeat-like-containing domain protein [Blastocladiella britannica]